MSERALRCWGLPLIPQRSSNYSRIVPTPVDNRFIRLVNLQMPTGKIAISGLRVFGTGKGEKLITSRLKRSRRTARESVSPGSWPNKVREMN